MANTNIFETLLGSIAEADRVTFAEIAERNPGLKIYIADPSKVSQVESAEKWYVENWDFDHEMPKAEYQLRIANKDLEAQLVTSAAEKAALAAKGEESMNLDQLNAYLDERIKDGKVVSAAQMKEEVTGIVSAKEKEFQDYTANILNSVASTATVVPYLNQRHEKEFGELFHPNDLLKAANEAKATDLEAFYDTKYVAEKRAAKNAAASEAAKAAQDAAIAAAREEGRKSALQERVGQDGQTPSIEGSPEMGHFQARLMKVEDKTESSIPKDAVLGRGQIAAAAARDYERAKLTNGAA